jgi:Flp pilus assembly protein TadD, contains TPR repeats
MDKAESIAQEALTILPQEPSLHFNLANTLGKAGRFAEAEKHFMEAIGLDMKNALYYTNLGESQTHDDSEFSSVELKKKLYLLPASY